MKRILTLAVAVIALAVVGAACSGSPSAAQKDQRAVNRQLGTYQTNQPIPGSTWSQYRETLINVEQAQIHGNATTTFFFNQGSIDPIKVCPSIGFPVASTSQLTNPQQPVYSGDTGVASIDQQEPNGTYTGSSLGTYVVCVDSGKPGVDYWEGFVHTEGGVAHWDRTTHSIVPDGPPTVPTKVAP